MSTWIYNRNLKLNMVRLEFFDFSFQTSSCPVLQIKGITICPVIHVKKKI